MPSRQNGILIANYSLVLQHVRLNDAGHYSCQAENYIGATESNKHELMIKCKHDTVVDFTIKCSEANFFFSKCTEFTKYIEKLTIRISE